MYTSTQSCESRNRGEEREKKLEIIVENVPNFLNDIYLYIQENINFHINKLHRSTDQSQ